MKGISPIIASVLLIAITMSIAVILAAYVTSYTRTTTQAIPTTCIGGALFVDTETCTGSTLTLDLRGEYVELSDLKVDTRSSTGLVDNQVTLSPTTSLLPGQTATYTATIGSCAAITQFRVTTNCFNVNTNWINK